MLKFSKVVDRATNAKTFDVSASGCFLITDHPYEADATELNLKLRANQSHSSSSGSQQATKNPQGIGVKFTSHLMKSA